MKLNPKLYYILNFTWGIIMNIIGGLAAAGLMALGKKPERHAGLVVFRIGRSWGGVNLGIFSIVSEDAPEATLDHEFGHSLQNAIWGPLFPFVIALPSAKRYWTFTNNQKKGIPNTENYDDAWFEGQASSWGTQVAQLWNK